MRGINRPENDLSDISHKNGAQPYSDRLRPIMNRVTFQFLNIATGQAS